MPVSYTHLRYDELTEKGVSCALAEIENDIIDRDYRDMHRETSPLHQDGSVATVSYTHLMLFWLTVRK